MANESQKYFLIVGSPLNVALMETSAKNPIQTAENLGCQLANPTAKEGEGPWVLNVPLGLRKILIKIVEGAGGFDGEEIFYLTRGEVDFSPIRGGPYQLENLLPGVVSSMIADYLSAQ